MPYLLGHLAAYAAFAAVTARLLSGDPDQVSGGTAWFVAWALTGLATIALWVAAGLPPRAWGPLLRRGSWVLAAAIGVGVAAWAAGQLTNLLWEPMSRATFATVSGLLRLTGTEVVTRPERLVIGTPAFRIQIAPDCSGYEGIGLIWVFLIVFLWVFRRDLRFPNALLLIPLGTAVIWVANAVRIAALILLARTAPARWRSADSTRTPAGWVHRREPGADVRGAAQPLLRRVETPTAAGRNLVAAYLGPLLALVGTAMVTGAFAAGFDSLYPVRIVVATGVLWYYWDDYADLKWTWSWVAAAVGVTVFGLWMALEPPGTMPDPLVGWPRFSVVVWLTVRVVGSVIVVPLAEELAFRSFLTRRLIAADFTEVRPGQFSWPSFLISSPSSGRCTAAGWPGRWPDCSSPWPCTGGAS